MCNVGDLAVAELWLDPLEQALVLGTRPRPHLRGALRPPALDEITDRRGGALGVALGHRVAALIDESAQPAGLVAGQLQRPIGGGADRQSALDSVDAVVEDPTARVVLGDA